MVRKTLLTFLGMIVLGFATSFALDMASANNWLCYVGIVLFFGIIFLSWQLIKWYLRQAIFYITHLEQNQQDSVKRKVHGKNTAKDPATKKTR